MNFDPPRDGRHQSSEAVIDFAFATRALRRRAVLILGVLVVGVGGSLAYLHTQQPTYVSVAELLIEPRHATGDLNFSGGGDLVDSAEVESQVEILRASIIAEAVVRKLDLVDDPEFAPPRDSAPSLLSRIEAKAARTPPLKAIIGADEEPARPAPSQAPQQKLNMAVASFASKISVRRLGQSNVVEVAFAANSPEKAERIAAETVDVYLGGTWRDATSPNAFRRFNDDVLRKSRAVSNVRVISAPLPPLGKSSPRTLLVIGFAAAASLFLGVSLAIWLEGRAERRRKLAREFAEDEAGATPFPARSDLKSRYPVVDARR